MAEENFDSSWETIAHIQRVQQLVDELVHILEGQVGEHDRSKLNPPEKQIFDKFTPKLKGLTYGSDEYNACLSAMKPALDNHYASNLHHPEHFKNGIDGMDLIDLIEMFCDWKAATERHADGSLGKSIGINARRFRISPQLEAIFRNTQRQLDW
jgi:hypothetical protein